MTATTVIKQISHSVVTLSDRKISYINALSDTPKRIFTLEVLFKHLKTDEVLTIDLLTEDGSFVGVMALIRSLKDSKGNPIYPRVWAFIDSYEVAKCIEVV